MAIFDGKSRSLLDQLRTGGWTDEEERKRFVALFIEAREFSMKPIAALVKAVAGERDPHRLTQQLLCIREIVTAMGGREEIPILVDLIKTGSGPVRQHLAEALIAIHDKAEAATLVELVRHEKQEVRQTGEMILGRVGGRSVYEALGNALTEGAWASRLEGLSAIARIAGHHSIPQLQAVLKIAPKQEKLLCLELLGNQELMKLRKRQAIDALKPYAVDADPDVRAKVASILGEVGEAEDVPMLIELLQGAERRNVQILIRSLGKIGDARAVKPLIPYLSSPYVGLRIEALQALGRFEDDGVVDHLIEGLRDGELLVRQKAMEVLGELGRSPKIRIGRMLVRMMRDRDVNVRRGVIEVIKAVETAGEEGRTVWGKLVQHLKDEDWWVRESVTDVLAEVGGEEILDGVIQLLNEKSDILRRYAIEVIVRIGDQRAVPHLVRAIQDPDWWVRERAVEALAELKVAAAVPLIVDLLKNEDLRWIAAKALGEIGDKRAVEPLAAALATGRVEFRLEALAALDALHDPRAIEPVRALLKDPDKQVRHRAEQFLNAFEVKVSVEELHKMSLRDMKLIDRLLLETRARGGHDLFILTGMPPHIKHQGEVRPMLDHPLGREEVDKILIDIMNPVQRKEFFEDGEDVDFSYSIKSEAGRFRVNVYRQWTGPGAVFRVISNNIMTIEELKLPKTVTDFCRLRNGLVLVTGPTGSGKTTTLAAIIDHINKNRAEHIITIEDPIEYVHEDKLCVINQREIGVHTLSFSEALRASLRQDPDVILVGELRDYETIATAITAAETGHLVLGTLHTVSAAKTVDRIIDVFPPTFQGQIRMMISESLRGVVSQHLLRRRDGKGLTLALEVMICNEAISNLIRKEKTYQIPTMLATGAEAGNQLMDNELLKLMRAGMIDPEDAYAKAENKREFEGYLKPAGPEATGGNEAGAGTGAATRGSIRPRPSGTTTTEPSAPPRPRPSGTASADPGSVRSRPPGVPEGPGVPKLPAPSHGPGKPQDGGGGGHGKN